MAHNYMNHGFQQDAEKTGYDESYPNSGEGNFEQLEAVRKFPEAGAGEPADAMNQSYYDEQDRDGYPGTAYGVAADCEKYDRQPKLDRDEATGVCNDGQDHAEKWASE
jgi:hypothetical protein